MHAFIRSLFDIEHALGRRVAIGVQVAVVLSLIAFSITTLPELSDNTVVVLEWFETAAVLLFSAEYVLRIVAAKRKLRFVFSFFGLVDLLAVLPYFLGLGMPSSSLRMLRLFRLIRVLKLAKYSRAVDRLVDAFKATSAELTLFIIMALILIYFAATGMYLFENEAQPEVFASVFHSMWWAVATLSTVGYGDAYPITTGGKIFAAFIVLMGVGIVAVPSGILAAALTRRTGQSDDQP